MHFDRLRFFAVRIASAAFVCGVLSLFAIGRASADPVEFCPARLLEMTPAGADAAAGAASTYSYDLTALARRTVNATLIADTDKGWFQWNVTSVPLGKATYSQAMRAAGRGAVAVTYESFGSPQLSVDFPRAVVINHAWVRSVQIASDGPTPPDAPKTVACRPTFAGTGPESPKETLVSRISYSSEPSVPASHATATTPPFEPRTCATPFSGATVKVPIAPDFPSNAAGMFSGAATAFVDVAVDSDGSILATWMLVSSGVSSLDAAAVVAARRSTFVPQMAYCEPVKGTYVFRATFTQ
jgi:outer membrane biosynthesis protein TonB